MNVLILGDIRIEIPPRESIQISGQRSIAKHDVPGYRPRYQDMGPDERIISFDGIFIGSGALDKAIAIEVFWKGPANSDDGTDKAGYPLIYEDVAYRVIIKKFDYSYRHKERVNYNMELVRLDSDSSPKVERLAEADPVAKAKSALDKLNDLLSKAEEWQRKGIEMARKIGDDLYTFRQAWVRITNVLRLPGLRLEFERIKQSLDRSLATVRGSVGSVGYKKSAAYQKALKELKTTMIDAGKVLDSAQKENVQQRIENAIADMPQRAVKQGESLRDIATELFGSHHKWITLARINQLTTPDIPADKMYIRVPQNLGSVEKLFAEQTEQLPPVAPNYIPPFWR